MTITEKLNKVNTFSKEWLKDVFGINSSPEFEVNNRLKSTGGQFVVTKTGGKTTSEKLEIAGFVLEHNEWDEVEGIVKHELVHYGLYKMGLPYGDKDEKFKSLCKELHVPLSHRAKRKNHVYGCAGCGMEFNFSRKDGHRYRCGICGEKIHYMRDEIS